MDTQIDLLDAIDEAQKTALSERLSSENANILPGQYWHVVYHRFYEPGFAGNTTQWLLGNDDDGCNVWASDRKNARRFTWDTARRYSGRGNGVTMVRYNEEFPRQRWTS